MTHNHLSEEMLAKVLQNRRLEDIDTAGVFDLVRGEQAIEKFVPEGIVRVDPRDGAVVTFNSKRAKRPHTNTAVPRDEPEDHGAECPICHGRTTGIIDVAPLSKGFTFINKNLFPVAHPQDAAPQDMTRGELPHGAGCSDARGLHLLQWTSNYDERDWHNMPDADLEIVLDRLGVLEHTLLFESGERDQPAGHVVIIKNYGRLVGGSLAHGHQQILYTNVPPRHFCNNRRFQEQRGECFADFMLRENPEQLVVRDYGPVVLMVPYFMRRPYNMLLAVKRTSCAYLHQLDDAERSATAAAWKDAIQAIRAIMDAIDRPIAFNVTVHNGPGCGLYCEFLPYTQEMGGFEQLGFWVCQGTPEGCAETLRETLGDASAG